MLFQMPEPRGDALKMVNVVTGQFRIAGFCTHNRVIADRAFVHGLEGTCLRRLSQVQFSDSHIENKIESANH